MMPGLTDMRLEMLREIDKEIGHCSERASVYVSALVELARQARLAGEPLEAIDGPDPADLRRRMLQSCERAINDNRSKMLRYARAAKDMALYERLVAGGSSDIPTLRCPGDDG